MDWIETDSSEVCLRLGVSDQVKLTAESDLFHPGAILGHLRQRLRLVYSSAR